MNPNAWLRDASGGLIRISSIDKVLISDGRVHVRISGSEDWHTVARIGHVDPTDRARHTDAVAGALARVGTGERPVVIGWDGVNGPDGWFANWLDE